MRQPSNAKPANSKDAREFPETPDSHRQATDALTNNLKYGLASHAKPPTLLQTTVFGRS